MSACSSSDDKDDFTQWLYDHTSLVGQYNDLGCSYSYSEPPYDQELLIACIEIVEKLKDLDVAEKYFDEAWESAKQQNPTGEVLLSYVTQASLWLGSIDESFKLVMSCEEFFDYPQTTQSLHPVKTCLINKGILEKQEKWEMDVRLFWKAVQMVRDCQSDKNCSIS